MKQSIGLIVMVAWFGLCGCSAGPLGNQDGVGVVFDSAPRLYDSSVVFMGMPVGKVLSGDSGNGIHRVIISMDGQSNDLLKTNLAAVVSNGRLTLKQLNGYGTPLAPGACIIGFKNIASYQWFKFKHLINNITISADRRAQRLLAHSGLAG